jgi:hypothetical protein
VHLQAGGLGWDARHIGALMSFGGGALALSNFVLFPRLAEGRPIPTLFIASAALLSFVYAAPPLLPLVGHAALLPALLLHNAAAQSLASMCFTAVFLLINDSCSAAARGRVNGLGMALSSAFKALYYHLRWLYSPCLLWLRSPWPCLLWPCLPWLLSTSFKTVGMHAYSYRDSPPPSRPWAPRSVPSASPGRSITARQHGQICRAANGRADRLQLDAPSPRLGPGLGLVLTVAGPLGA